MPSRHAAQVGRASRALQNVLGVVFVENDLGAAIGARDIREIARHFDPFDLNDIERVGRQRVGARVHRRRLQAERHVRQRRGQRSERALRKRARRVRRNLDAVAQRAQRLGVRQFVGCAERQQGNRVARREMLDDVEIADCRALMWRVRQLRGEDEQVHLDLRDLAVDGERFARGAFPRKSLRAL